MRYSVLLLVMSLASPMACTDEEPPSQAPIHLPHEYLLLRDEAVSFPEGDTLQLSETQTLKLAVRAGAAIRFAVIHQGGPASFSTAWWGADGVRHGGSRFQCAEAGCSQEERQDGVAVAGDWLVTVTVPPGATVTLSYRTE